MELTKNHIQIVKDAQRGDRDSLNLLAEIARPGLERYVQRITLDKHLTDDIVQDSILEMYKILSKLEDATLFFGWICKIAHNKTRSHYGRKWRHNTVSLSVLDVDIEQYDKTDALEDMVTAELKQVVKLSIKQLKPEHRAILNLRCYENMPYDKIAEIMDCTNIGARARFYRAKKCLAKQLAKRGFSKGTLILALGVFGKLTAASEAAAAKVAVTASTLKTGLTGTVAGALGSKAAVTTIATIGIVGAGTAAVLNNGPEQNELSVIENRPLNSVSVLAANGVESSIQQHWYYYPENSRDIVMRRITQYDNEGNFSYYKHLQNHIANYQYDKNTEVVYITNNRYHNPDMSVSVLPSDDGFENLVVDQVENNSGLLVTTKSDEMNNEVTDVTYHHNLLKEDYFQFSWPLSIKTIDIRDEMHRRGWTFFSVSGKLGGREVSGVGRVPFVYAMYRHNPPWLKISVGQKELIDAGKEKLFSGLPRPWQGLHTIDTIRRDAAKMNIPFQTVLSQDNINAIITLDTDDTQIAYTINLEKDIVEKIVFTGSLEGVLTFTYLQNVDETDSNFKEPERNTALAKTKGILWLTDLVEGHVN